MALTLDKYLPSRREDINWLEVAKTGFIYGTAVFAGLVAGVISSSGRLALVAIFAGLIAGLAVISYRKALLWFVILGGIVIVGTAQLYLPGSKYIRYIIPLATLVLIFYAVMDRISSKAASNPAIGVTLTQCLIAFLGISLMSTIINTSDTGVAIMGLKGYFQMWALFFGLIFIRWRADIIDSIPKGMLLIAFLQLPFVLHQYIFLVPKRVGLGSGVVAVDVIAGTFGASMFGGGANAVLAAFMMIVVACLLAIWKNGGLSTTKTTIMCLLFLAPVFINEAKISAIYLPMIFCVVFYNQIIRAPLKFLGAAIALGILLAGMLTALTLSQQSGKLKTWSDLVEFTVERQTASTAERRGQYSELSRLTALTFWAEEHVKANPVYTLIGHGPGASRVQDGGLNLATTLAETRYSGLQIGYTAASAVLWDTGILGLGTVLAAFYAAFRLAGRLGRRYRDSDPVKAGLFEGLRAGLTVLGLSLFHKDFFAFHIPYQTLIMLIFGYLVISATQAARAEQNQPNA